MFPFVFEWHWDAAHLVFHGGLWYALSILGLGLGYCFLKAIYDVTMSNAEKHGDEHN